MRSRAAARVRTLVALALVVVLVYVGMQIIPVAAASYQFDDRVREQVVRAGARRLRVSDAEIRSQLVREAGELGLPVTERSILIHRTGDSIRIEVNAVVTVHFVLDLSYDWTVAISHEGPSF